MATTSKSTTGDFPDSIDLTTATDNIDRNTADRFKLACSKAGVKLCELTTLTKYLAARYAPRNGTAQVPNTTNIDNTFENFRGAPNTLLLDAVEGEIKLFMVSLEPMYKQLIDKSTDDIEHAIGRNHVVTSDAVLAAIELWGTDAMTIEPWKTNFGHQPTETSGLNAQAGEDTSWKDPLASVRQSTGFANRAARAQKGHNRRKQYDKATENVPGILGFIRDPVWARETILNARIDKSPAARDIVSIASATTLLSIKTDLEAMLDDLRHQLPMGKLPETPTQS